MATNFVGSKVSITTTSGNQYIGSIIGVNGNESILLGNAKRFDPVINENGVSTSSTCFTQVPIVHILNNEITALNIVNGDEKDRKTHVMSLSSTTQPNQSSIDENQTSTIPNNENLNVPLIGHVYGVRHGIEAPFGVTPQSTMKSSTSSSSNSSSISCLSMTKNQNDYRMKPRPALVWRIHQQSIEVLLMTSFDGEDPLDQTKVLPIVSRATLMKHLLLISSQNSFEAESVFPGNTLTALNTEKDTYIILIPITVKLEQRWKKKFIGSLNKIQMKYINNKLKELAFEAIAEQEKTIEKLNLTARIIAGHDDDDDDLGSNSSSSSSKSLPKPRAMSANISHIDKNHFINNWLHDVSIDNGQLEMTSSNACSPTSDVDEDDFLLTDISMLSQINQSLDPHAQSS